MFFSRQSRSTTSNGTQALRATRSLTSAWFTANDGQQRHSAGPSRPAPGAIGRDLPPLSRSLAGALRLGVTRRLWTTERHRSPGRVPTRRDTRPRVLHAAEQAPPGAWSSGGL